MYSPMSFFPAPAATNTNTATATNTANTTTTTTTDATAGLIVKLVRGPHDIRRFHASATRFGYENLRAKVAELFPAVRQPRLTWTDDDGDVVSLASADDWAEAVQWAQHQAATNRGTPTLRIAVNGPAQPTAAAAARVAVPPVVFPTVSVSAPPPAPVPVPASASPAPAPATATSTATASPAPVPPPPFSATTEEYDDSARPRYFWPSPWWYGNSNRYSNSNDGVPAHDWCGRRRCHPFVGVSSDNNNNNDDEGYAEGYVGWRGHPHRRRFGPWQRPFGPAAVDANGLVVHRNVSCDLCGMYPIVGDRYKCTICDDYDLCAACEEKDLHPSEHPLIKMRVPFYVGAWNPAVIQRIQRMHGRRFREACRNRRHEQRDQQQQQQPQQQQQQQQPAQQQQQEQMIGGDDVIDLFQFCHHSDATIPVNESAPPTGSPAPAAAAAAAESQPAGTPEGQQQQQQQQQQQPPVRDFRADPELQHYAYELSVLRDMGFTNEEQNLELVRTISGGINAVIDQLTSMRF